VGEIAVAVDSFVKTFAAGMKKRDFTRRGRRLYRWRPHIVDLVYVQGAPRNKAAREFPDADTAYLYVNLYAYFPEIEEGMELGGERCPKWSRFSTRLDGTERDEWRFTAAASTDVAERCLAVFDAVGEAWFQAQTYENIVAHAEATGYPEVRALLAAELLGVPERYWAVHARSPNDAFVNDWLDRIGRRP
jgi:hypothetical protein